MSFTEADCRAVLAESISSPVRGVQSMPGGAWSSVFVAETDEGRVVVRVGGMSAAYAKDGAAARLYASPSLPIPAELARGILDGTAYSVTEHVPGVAVEEALSTGDQATRQAFSRLLLELTATPARRPGWGGWDDSGAGTLHSWTEHLLQVHEDGPTHPLAGWRASLARHPSRLAASDELYAVLESSARDDVPRGVIHADTVNRNIHVDRGRVTGIFDWGNAAIGDPLYDIAWLEFWSPWSPKARLAELASSVLAEWPTTENLAYRRRLCHLHIALDHVAYYSFRGNWTNLDHTISRAHALIARG